MSSCVEDCSILFVGISFIAIFYLVSFCRIVELTTIKHIIYHHQKANGENWIGFCGITKARRVSSICSLSKLKIFLCHVFQFLALFLLFYKCFLLRRGIEKNFVIWISWFHSKLEGICANVLTRCVSWGFSLLTLSLEVRRIQIFNWHGDAIKWKWCDMWGVEYFFSYIVVGWIMKFLCLHFNRLWSQLKEKIFN